MAGRCAFVSFRLGLSDGVSVVARSWQRCFDDLGWDTFTVAGEGPVDRTVSGLELGATQPPDPAKLETALADADLVVAENILTIPMNPPASRAVAAALADRPAIIHHHDPPWQRERFAHITELPVDGDHWVHVTINRLTEREFADRGFPATTIYNGFDPDPPPGDRAAARRALDVADGELLVVHPVRAIERKNVPAALALTEALGGTYWLPGPAEDGYAPTLERLLDDASCPVRRATVPELGPGSTMADVYAACDLVAFPSLWEGFGNPPIEAAFAQRPVAVGRYPVSRELRDLGFDWLDPDDSASLTAALDPSAAPDLAATLAHNRRIAGEHLSFDVLASRVKELLDRAGWTV